ncbi:DUF3850 domain-containing protein [Vibrio mimicus]|uniref:DUF3850 domain-containing protein n=1 Tax=Vibrio mimicus TaxID=674 RepID=UPI000878D977|nr:DUF3850 domain-containing protein [Vibrio mimicus]AOW84205.1 hypothetical protein VM_15950 [Vibrio mimicus]
MNTHQVRTYPTFLDAVLLGDKTFEITKNDRGYEVGDLVLMTDDSRWAEIKIKYMTSYAQRRGYVVFSFDLINSGVFKGAECPF